MRFGPWILLQSPSRPKEVIGIETVKFLLLYSGQMKPMVAEDADWTDADIVAYCIQAKPEVMVRSAIVTIACAYEGGLVVTNLGGGEEVKILRIDTDGEITWEIEERIK